MSKDKTQTDSPTSEQDRAVTLAEVRELLALQRAEHERQVEVLLQRLAAAPGVGKEVTDQLNQRMLESVNVHEYINAQNRKTEEWLASEHGHAAQRALQGMLIGTHGYLLALRHGPNELNHGRGGRFEEYSASVVFADGSEVESRAIAFDKWFRSRGISAPPQFFLQVALPPEQAEVMRAELTKIVDAIGMDAHPYHAQCRIYLFRYLREQDKRLAAQQAEIDIVPDTLPNPMERLYQGQHMPGVNSPFPTFERADDGVIMVDGSMDIRELMPAGL